MAYEAHDRQRWVSEDPAHKRADRDDFARDRGRIVHSAALRRLSAKTQVLQPGIDDFVRNRLTHSLEVAQIGREFGSALGCNGDVVDTACLAHDLGHPPFGHNGERALDELARDIGGFEGNAQTLRLLTRLEPKRFHPDGRPAGLNLTRASLDAATKYPWLRGEEPRETTKFGAYESDAAVFAWLREDAPSRRRCVEAQVMDWADDVAYSVHDVEDGVAGGRIDPRVLRDPHEVSAVIEVARASYVPELTVDALALAHERILATGLWPRLHEGTRRDLAALKDMTSRFVGRFCSVVADATRAAHGTGPLTRYAADLVLPEEVRAEIAFLKAMAARYVMRTDERAAIMEGEREVVADLVDAYATDPARLDPLLREDFEAAAAGGDETAARRTIIDQVASLTDGRALGLHRQWC